MKTNTLVYGELKNLGREIAKTIDAANDNKLQSKERAANDSKLQDDEQSFQDSKPCVSIAIITDQNVAALYLNACVESLEDQGFHVFCKVIPPGEESKNGEVYLSILESMAKDGITRTDGIVALGGGVVGDLAGFVAATYMRGIKVYQVPTSLLAMVDSSIGGKTGIDLDAGKNLAGAFHMPSLVYQDFGTLSTLPEEELINGMAEIIKYGVLAGGEFYELLTPDEDGNIDLERLIRMSAEYKMDIVSRDAKDMGERQLLNLGHTFGHAIEKLSNYEIKHGFAVAKGLALIADLSGRHGWCSEETRDSIVGTLDIWGYDLSIPCDMNEMLDAIAVDKKRKADYIDLVVPTVIGNCELKRMSMEELYKCLL